MSLDLFIAYRVYPGVSKVPAIHADNKLALTELALRSFKRALGSLRVHVLAILDGCPPEYEALFRSLFNESELTVMNCNKVGNAATFALQLDAALSQTHAEYVYLAEDDYFYLPNAVQLCHEFMRAHPTADFVTSYDHPDYYSMDLHRTKEEEVGFGDRRWSTVGTTCLTFMARKESLAEAEAVMRSFERKNYDTGLWLVLTRRKLINPFSALTLALQSAWMMRVVVKSWLTCFGAILGGRRFSLWVPRPTLSTHLESTGLSPGVDWQEEFKKIVE